MLRESVIVEELRLLPLETSIWFKGISESEMKRHIVRALDDLKFSAKDVADGYLIVCLGWSVKIRGEKDGVYVILTPQWRNEEVQKKLKVNFFTLLQNITST